MIGYLSRTLPSPVINGLTAAFFRYRAWKTNTVNCVHSQNTTFSTANMKVQVLPALEDNYMYLIIDEETKDAAIVDPVAPESVISAVNKEGINLKSILTTHHHWDHAGGNKKLASKIPGIKVYGGDSRVEGLTDKIHDGDKINIGQLEISCIFTPCHTTGHICYYIKPNNEPGVVFTGDTLFIAGCGRFFEGTADQMYKALIDKLGKLPNDTKVFCGHEYTVSNLVFAGSVEPENAAISKKLKWAELKRKESLPTVPSTIGEEKETNPFMRVIQESVQKIAKSNDPIITMDSIRKLKDNFRR